MERLSRLTVKTGQLMNKKNIIFDLDGVLIDTKIIHYHSLNKALCKISPEYFITEQEHVLIYDGLSTHAKLKLLSKSLWKISLY